MPLMYSDYLQVSLPLIGLIINVLTQIVCFRYIVNPELLKSVFLGFSIGLMCMLVLEFYIFFYMAMSNVNFAAILIANIIIYFSLGYCYFNFINLGETARRIRLVRELYDSEDGLTMEEILERYNSKEIIDKRINRLITNKQILYKNGRYFIGKPMVLFIAKLMVMMKLFLLGKSEVD